MENKTKLWYAVGIETRTETEEAIEFALNELDSLGNEINHLGQAATEYLTVIGYFNEKIEDQRLRRQISEGLKIYGFSDEAVRNIEWREVENQDWLAEWKKHWQPTTVGKFIIAPTWSEVDNSNGEIIIRIDPEMAFGTGTHETTRLCLQAIQEINTAGGSFLDVGTGTGILAIAYALEHPGNFIAACDTDKNSVKIAMKNAALNNVEGRIDFFAGSITPETPEFDFVCANLTADVIIPLLPQLLEKAGSRLILSGILREQQILVENELKRQRVTNWKAVTLGEWISMEIDCRSIQIG